MSRPRWPLGVVLPVGAIQRIREEQEAYDRDPEGYERRQRQAAERRAEEAEQERQAEEDFWRRQQEQPE